MDISEAKMRYQEIPEGERIGILEFHFAGDKHIFPDARRNSDLGMFDKAAPLYMQGGQNLEYQANRIRSRVATEPKAVEACLVFVLAAINAFDKARESYALAEHRAKDAESKDRMRESEAQAQKKVDELLKVAYEVNQVKYNQTSTAAAEPSTNAGTYASVKRNDKPVKAVHTAVDVVLLKYIAKLEAVQLDIDEADRCVEHKDHEGAAKAYQKIGKALEQASCSFGSGPNKGQKFTETISAKLASIAGGMHKTAAMQYDKLYEITGDSKYNIFAYGERANANRLFMAAGVILKSNVHDGRVQPVVDKAWAAIVKEGSQSVRTSVENWDARIKNSGAAVQAPTKPEIIAGPDSAPTDAQINDRPTKVVLSLSAADAAMFKYIFILESVRFDIDEAVRCVEKEDYEGAAKAYRKIGKALEERVAQSLHSGADKGQKLPEAMSAKLVLIARGMHKTAAMQYDKLYEVTGDPTYNGFAYTERMSVNRLFTAAGNILKSDVPAGQVQQAVDKAWAAIIKDGDPKVRERVENWDAHIKNSGADLQAPAKPEVLAKFDKALKNVQIPEPENEDEAPKAGEAAAADKSEVIADLDSALKDVQIPESEVAPEPEVALEPEAAPEPVVAPEPEAVPEPKRAVKAPKAIEAAVAAPVDNSDIDSLFEPDLELEGKTAESELVEETEEPEKVESAEDYRQLVEQYEKEGDKENARRARMTYACMLDKEGKILEAYEERIKAGVDSKAALNMLLEQCEIAGKFELAADMHEGMDKKELKSAVKDYGRNGWFGVAAAISVKELGADPKRAGRKAAKQYAKAGKFDREAEMKVMAGAVPAIAYAAAATSYKKAKDFAKAEEMYEKLGTYEKVEGLDGLMAECEDAAAREAAKAAGLRLVDDRDVPSEKKRSTFIQALKGLAKRGEASAEDTKPAKAHTKKERKQGSVAVLPEDAFKMHMEAGYDIATAAIKTAKQLDVNGDFSGAKKMWDKAKEAVAPNERLMNRYESMAEKSMRKAIKAMLREYNENNQ
jgi:hypothetical protein